MPHAKDEADIAAEHEDAWRTASLRKQASQPLLPFRGHCYNCGERTSGNFCDTDCRRDWEREQASKVRNGGRDEST